MVVVTKNQVPIQIINSRKIINVFPSGIESWVIESIHSSWVEIIAHADNETANVFMAPSGQCFSSIVLVFVVDPPISNGNKSTGRSGGAGKKYHRYNWKEHLYRKAKRFNESTTC